MLTPSKYALQSIYKRKFGSAVLFLLIFILYTHVHNTHIYIKRRKGTTFFWITQIKYHFFR